METTTTGPYHRLAHNRPNYRWWRPLTALLTAVAGYLAVGVLAMLMALVGLIGWTLIQDTAVGTAIEELMAATGFDSSADPELDDMGNPLTMSLIALSIVAILPSCLVATRIGWKRPVGELSSVAGRLRWRRFWPLLGWAGLVIVPVFTVQAMVVRWRAEGETIGLIGHLAEGLDGRTVLLVVLILVLIPFQAAAEEYLFRGFLAQVIGSWLRHPAWAILLPLPIFVFGHTYDWTGLADVAVFAVITGILTYMTGGLEAGIALHAVNNVTLFVLGAFGLTDINADSQSPLALVISIATTIGTGWVLLSASRRADRKYGQ